MNNFIIKGGLSPKLVDKFSELVEETLKDTKISHKDILRYRLSVETAMSCWLKVIPLDSECTYEVRKRFGKTTVLITCEGAQCNPIESYNEEFGQISNSTLLQSLGLSVGFSYENGINQISFMPPAGLTMHVAPVAIAVVMSLVVSFIFKCFLPEFGLAINEQLVTPIFDAMMNLLKTIAGPMIFLAVLSGIYGIGDLTLLGKLGKKLIVRYLIMTYVSLFISLFLIIPFVKVSAGSYAGGGTLSSVIGLALQFIPTDIVSPFLDGNMLQIIFIAVVCGIGMLILGKKVSSLCNIVDQIYSVVQLLMEAIGKLVPFFVFISLYGFIISNNSSEIETFLLPIGIIAGSLLLIAVVLYGILINAKYKTGFIKLFKKLIPTFAVALTTASSAAAFSVNIETCETKLGIASNITKFGIPLGQVIYMPAAAVEFLSISMIIAQNYSVTITPAWIITAVLICGILAVATPPIPGGALSILTVMFLQLNIPAEALSIAISIDLIADYIVTAGDITCLQEELILCAGETGYLDIDCLNK